MTAPILADLPTFEGIDATLRIQATATGPMVWLALGTPDGLVPAVRILKTRGARLAMITALPTGKLGAHDVVYHFVAGGVSVQVTATVPPDGSVETIVPLYRNADWHEREFAEFYPIGITGRADTRSLFLDDSIQARRNDGLIPLSTLANAASTQTLWEKLVGPRETRS